jgi:hypothetical protein
MVNQTDSTASYSPLQEFGLDVPLRDVPAIANPLYSEPVPLSAHFFRVAVMAQGVCPNANRITMSLCD